MAIFVFALGLILAVGGLGGLLASVDLLPTERGMLYAGCGVIALSASFIIFSIAALIRSVEGLGTLPPAAEPVADPGPEHEPAPPEPERFMDEDETSREASEAETAEEEPINENRSGHLPTLVEVEQAIAHPEAPATLVGRYSAGGASYMIFSDGTIEAETEEGAFRFASMGDFKAYLAGRKS
jgi:hypothetical protein